MGRRLFRAMYADADKLPESGRSADKLGVRVHARTPTARVDIHLTDGKIAPGTPAEGLSVQIDDPTGAPPFRLPRALGGTSEATLFELDEDDLPELLELVADHDSHGVIRPRRPCSLEEYEAALSESRSKWRITDVDEL